jgi:hypothetical protein
MNEERFDPVRYDREATLDRAMKRPGFKEAWEASADEYTALRALLCARVRVLAFLSERQK